MIDLLKYYIVKKDKFIETIKNSDKVDLRTTVNTETAVISDKQTAYYNESIFINITNNRASLKGSIHKYYNIIKKLGNQNYNDFSYRDFKLALYHLQNSFDIEYCETDVTNLEFGLNIEIEEDPQELIDNHILMYDYKLPNRNDKFRGKGDYIEYKTTDYSLKIYNKSKQNSIKDRNLLRIELKIIGSRYLKKHFKIYNLNDLDRNRFQLLFNKLLEHFDKLLIVDRLCLKNTDRMDEMILYQNGINPNYWKRINKNKKTKFKFKNDFENFLKSNSLLKKKMQLKYLLTEKYKELMNSDIEILKDVA
ncbi:hypothetical protein CW731_03185 [Polaribacter sp. ALD11]|uniref:hypothetical protein n=1 Tax=Polaribacter sp. ALD11 TaxID=2058137 RepID=UPI000C31956C|nr:hypothetical protein [Polaribacter sp. ALD11]AUC84360.1 hypothetical protein CW731_03185 [Polaribacter sp. ALD11]